MLCCRSIHISSPWRSCDSSLCNIYTVYIYISVPRGADILLDLGAFVTEHATELQQSCNRACNSCLIPAYISVPRGTDILLDHRAFITEHATELQQSCNRACNSCLIPVYISVSRGADILLDLGAFARRCGRCCRYEAAVACSVAALLQLCCMLLGPLRGDVDAVAGMLQLLHALLQLCCMLCCSQHGRWRGYAALYIYTIYIYL
jgi:hypothetical protein